MPPTPSPKAGQLRTVIIALNDLANVQIALDLLAQNQPLTAGESGLVAVDPIGAATLLGSPSVVFDGFKYTIFIWVTSA